MGEKSEKVHFLKCIFLLQKYFGPPNFFAHIKIESKIHYLGKRISILHRQMTEQMSFEIDVKNGQKSEKVHFLKCTFLVQMHFADQIFLAHMKFKSKIFHLAKELASYIDK